MMALQTASRSVPGVFLGQAFSGQPFLGQPIFVGKEPQDLFISDIWATVLGWSFEGQSEARPCDETLLPPSSFWAALLL